MIDYLTPEQILFIYARLIAETGGASGVRDLGLLLSAAARPKASLDGQDLYPDLFDKAAAMLDSLIRNHPFTDGNQRTAIVAAALFLASNGSHLQVSNEEMVEFILSCARSELTLAEISNWLRERSR